MSLINVTDVSILDNPTAFTNPFQFEITFECLPPGVQEELEWKLVYVGSAEDEKFDQELDSVLVGPVVVGKNKFVFQAPAPDAKLIPAKDVMEVTVLLLTASYRDKEFIRIGYYVNTDYPPEEIQLHAERNAWMERCRTLQGEYAEALQRVKLAEDAAHAAAVAAAAQNGAGGMAPEVESIGLEAPPEPVLPPPPAVHIARLTRNILADKPRVTRFQVPWDQQQGLQEFAMDAADEAKAREADAAERNNGTFDLAGSGAASAGGAEGGEEEEESSEEDDEMAAAGEDDVDEEADAGEQDAGEDEEEEEEEEEEQKTGPQSMAVE